MLRERCDGLIWPERVTHQVVQVAGGVDIAPAINVGDDGFERGKVRMNIEIRA